jgi:hypothetical protein
MFRIFGWMLVLLLAAAPALAQTKPNIKIVDDDEGEPPQQGEPVLKSQAITEVMLEAAPAEALAKITAKVLDTRGSGFQDFHGSEDGKVAIAVETRGEQERLAVWDLTTGKLVRYLSAIEGQETKPYAGKDDDNFGPAVDIPKRSYEKLVVSPSGKYVAGMSQPRGAEIPGARGVSEVTTWETATGKLVRRNSWARHHGIAFFFANDGQLLAKSMTDAGYGVDILNVETGKIEQLLKPANYEMYAGTVIDGAAIFMVPRGILSIDLKSKDEFRFKAPPPGASNHAANRLWHSADGKRLYMQKHDTLEIWDIATRNYVRDWHVRDGMGRRDFRAFATQANLIALQCMDPHDIDLFDLAKGRITSRLKLPFTPASSIRSFSGDGKRMAIGYNRNTLLLDFADGIPPGALKLDALVAEAKTSR